MMETIMTRWLILTDEPKRRVKLTDTPKRHVNFADLAAALGAAEVVAAPTSSGSPISWFAVPRIDGRHR